MRWNCQNLDICSLNSSTEAWLAYSKPIFKENNLTPLTSMYAFLILWEIMIMMKKKEMTPTPNSSSCLLKISPFPVSRQSLVCFLPYKYFVFYWVWTHIRCTHFCLVSFISKVTSKFIHVVQCITKQFIFIADQGSIL